MDGTTQVIFNLPTDVVEQLKSIAQAEGTTVTEALTKSIALSKFVVDQEAQNSEVLIQDPDGRIARVVRS